MPKSKASITFHVAGQEAAAIELQFIQFFFLVSIGYGKYKNIELFERLTIFTVSDKIHMSQ